MRTDEIFDAVNRNDLEKVKRLIEEENVSPTIRKENDAPSQETLALIAVEKGYLDMLKYLLKKDLPLQPIKSDTSNSSEHSSLLKTAIQNGHLDVVKYLVENHNVDIYDQFDGKFSAINSVIHLGHLNILKYFIEERNVDVNGLPVRTTEWYDSLVFRPLLFDALEYKREDIISYLIDERKANLTVVDARNENILFELVRKGDFGLIKYILDEKKAKIDINGINNDGYTLVHLCVAHTNTFEDSHSLGMKAQMFVRDPIKAVEILHYLIEEKHADFDIPAGVEQITPLLWAAKEKTSSSAEIIQYLINRGADVTKRDNNGDTALHLAVPAKSYDHGLAVCKCLCKLGANVNEKNKKKETPLDIALKRLSQDTRYDYVLEAMLETCKLFIEHGANINSTDVKGNKLVHFAVLKNQMPFLDYLVRDKQVDINSPRETDNWTLLHCAAFLNRLRICKYLIERGANIHAETKRGQTPAQVASDLYVIDYLNNTSTIGRSRRNVENYSPTLLQNLTYRGNPYERIVGLVNKDAISFTSENHSSTFGSQNFLSFISLLIRCSVNSSINSSRGQQLSSVSTAAILYDRMDPVAEKSVHYFDDFSNT